MTDHRLPNGLIGGLEKRVIIIVDYDLQWPVRFSGHAEKIKLALGDCALRIEHIGSTSVPGLGAKPIVDILLVVKDASDEAAYLPALVAADYELRVREPKFEEHRMFRTPERDVHVHVFPAGALEIERYLIFRDHLRKDEGDRKQYEELKRTLAKRDWADTNEYAEAKGDLIRSMIAKAREGRRSI